MKTIILVLMLLCVLSCDRIKHGTSFFPEGAINLSVLNTAFNDYNADLRLVSNMVEIIFSSDRNSLSGETRDYDLIPSQIVFSWDQETGVLSVRKSTEGFDLENLIQWSGQTISSTNERGSYTFYTSYAERVLLFSRNDDQLFSVNYLSRVPNKQTSESGKYSFRILDEKANEMYPSFYGRTFTKSDNFASQGVPEKLIFTSDREGKFDIYEVDLPSGEIVTAFLGNGESKNVRKLAINSEYNDHAPFVYGNLLVFASDRPGGYGGYDLYYSEYVGGQWSEPLNFGSKINSSSDEFRPVVSEGGVFANRLMIFSSDRPGGLGGFDLYYVGIPRF